MDRGRIVVDETSVTLPFADGDYTFFLPMLRVIAAEREAECSLSELFFWLGEHLGRVAEEMILAGPSPAKWKHCHAIIRNALIGGGADELASRELVATYCFPARPAIHDMALAWKILRAAIYGVEQGSKKNEAVAGDQSDSEKEPSSSTAKPSD